jgi:hypothetical protein
MGKASKAKLDRRARVEQVRAEQRRSDRRRILITAGAVVVAVGVIVGVVAGGVCRCRRGACLPPGVVRRRGGHRGRTGWPGRGGPWRGSGGMAADGSPVLPPSRRGRPWARPHTRPEAAAARAECGGYSDPAVTLLRSVEVMTNGPGREACEEHSRNWRKEIAVTVVTHEPPTDRPVRQGIASRLLMPGFGAALSIIHNVACSPIRRRHGPSPAHRPT